MTAKTKHEAPPWWELFITNVRRTGKIKEALDATRWKGKKLSRAAHDYHIKKSEELRLELETAIEEGTAAIKVARAEAVLDQLRLGTSLTEALKLADEAPSRFYVLLGETGKQELYEEITDYWYRKRKGYEEAIEYTERRLADDVEHYGEDASVVYIDLLREVLEACNKPSVELNKEPTVALRNRIIRIIGGEFKDEPDCPPFLQEDVDVAEALGGEGTGDHQGV